MAGCSMTPGRRLFPVTIVFTYFLFLLGIYTAAIGAGLTCGARWPLCDGAVFGLFPANWTSFVEWFHRFVALITGFMILGSWIVAWRSRVDRRALIAFTIAVLLLPPQVWLGAQTVLQYDIPTLTAHFLTPLIIFAGVLIGTSTVFRFGPLIQQYRPQLFATSLLLFLPFVVLTPQFLIEWTGAVQVLYYGIGLTIFAVLLLIAFSGADGSVLSLRIAGSLLLILLIIQLLAGRLTHISTMHTADWLAAFVMLPLLVAVTWFAYRRERANSTFADYA